MEPKITHLEMDWSETGGPFKSVGSPYVFGWLRAFYAPKMTFSGRGVAVLARNYDGSGWTEYRGQVMQADAEALSAGFAEMGLPQAAPRVEGIPSSGKSWHACHVRLAVGETVGTFSLHTEYRGFWGPDAAALTRIFRRIYELAGYDAGNTVFGDVG